MKRKSILILVIYVFIIKGSLAEKLPSYTY